MDEIIVKETATNKGFNDSMDGSNILNFLFTLFNTKFQMY